MVKYGFRVGSFEKMIVNKNGNFRIDSKGSITENGKNGWGRFTRVEVEKINKL
jgi:Asp-tRNA(Asn)/Glu-tRNA(Gln) amidotransferase B subunit